MKIGIFTNNYLPNPYGVANSIESFRRQFEKLGHTVYIFAPRTKGYTDQNPNVFRYPSIDIKYKISFPLAIPYSRRISKILEKLDLDIIHSQHPTLLGKTAMKWARRKKIPLVLTWHTLHEHYVHFAPLVPKKLAIWWINRKAVKYANRCDAVVTPTESVKKIIQDLGVINENIIPIPTGVEEEFYQNTNRNLIRKKYNISDDEILLLLVSRLTAEKNIEFLFRAIIRVLKLANNSKFLVAGEGHLVPKLKSMVKDNDMKNRVIFVGVVDKKEIKNYYAAADIFVYASKSETQGMIISEAMYAGLPIVAVNATGSKDLVEDSVNGFLVPEDENKFAEAVSKLVGNAELRRKFGENSAGIAREKYTDKVCAQRMLEIYAAALKHKKKPHTFRSGL
ncbi:MAG: glycosyltransferase [Candidatus Moranbacteria bacterium]|nr:glycosyltransferase [Candidatus Moranbacteria bacterium]